MNPTGIVRALSLVLLMAAGCGGVRSRSPGTAGMDADELVRRGLGAVERNEFKAALADFKAAERLDSSLDADLRVGHALFLTGEYEDARDIYTDYMKRRKNLPSWSKEELKEEIDRINAAMEKGDKPSGASLARRYFRVEAAMKLAESAEEREEYNTAFEQFDIASQYGRDPQIIFKAALAATKAEKYHDAIKRFDIYLLSTEEEIDRAFAYTIRAEVDRLNDIITGKEPVSWESLADRYYAKLKAASDKGKREKKEKEEINRSVDGSAVEDEEAGSSISLAAKTGAPEDVDTDTGPALIVTKDGAIKEVAPKKETQAQAKIATPVKVEEPSSPAKSPTSAEAAAPPALAKTDNAKTDTAKTDTAKSSQLDSGSQGGYAYKKVDSTDDSDQGAYAYRKIETNSMDQAVFSASVEAPERVVKKSGDAAKQWGRPVATLEELLFYTNSRLSSVRLKAVKDLTPLPSDQARLALEDRMMRDTSLQVRLASVDALVARKSVASVPIIRQAIMMAATSSERARLKKAMMEILGLR